MFPAIDRGVIQVNPSSSALLLWPVLLPPRLSLLRTKATRKPLWHLFFKWAPSSAGWEIAVAWPARKSCFRGLPSDLFWNNLLTTSQLATDCRGQINCIEVGSLINLHIPIYHHLSVLVVLERYSQLYYLKYDWSNGSVTLCDINKLWHLTNYICTICFDRQLVICKGKFMCE